MHKLLMACMFVGVVDCGLGVEPSAAPGEPCRSTTANALAPNPEIERLPAAAASVPQVLLKVRVMEVPLTKLRSLGISVDTVGSGARESNQHARETKNGTEDPDPPHVVSNCNLDDMFASPGLMPRLLDALLKDRLAKVLAEPTVVTISNRPAHFHCGGVARVAIPQGNGQVKVEEKPYGTQVDFLPVVLDDQTIRLTCRIELSQLDRDNGVTVAGETFPALGVRRVDTVGDFKAGQTVVLRGLRQQHRVVEILAAPDSPTEEGQKSDVSRTLRETVIEIETLLVLTPEIIEPMPSESATRTTTHR